MEEQDVLALRYKIEQMLFFIDNHYFHNDINLDTIPAFKVWDATEVVENFVNKLHRYISGVVIEFPNCTVSCRRYVYIMKKVVDISRDYLETFYQPNTLVPLRFLSQILEYYLELVIIYLQYQQLKTHNYVYPIQSVKSYRNDCVVFYQ
jgi:GTP1/Obg family GTP-binding protein